MDFLSVLEICNYGLVFVYGLLVSMHVAGDCTDKRQKTLMCIAVPLLFAIQLSFWLVFGVEATKMFYPLISHLPLVLILVFVLKKTFPIAFTSVFTAYLCCQLPRWVDLLVTHLSCSSLLGEISYTVSIFAFYGLLRRFFVRIAAEAMTYSKQNLYLFGSLPFVYYIFDYSTIIYSNALYAGIPVLTEFFPTALIIFYIAFLASYHKQTQKRAQVELQKSMLEAELKQSEAELESLRRIDSQTAIYQHNMRHHLNAISGFLASGNPTEAEIYIKNVQTDIEAITPKRFCENELVNLLCSSFSSKAEENGVRLSVDVRLPKKLTISDTELCSLLSNGLENALHAVSDLEENARFIEFYSDIRNGKLLFQVRNPYVGDITMQDEIPVSNKPGHGYGCRSIRSIVENNVGLCTFQAENGIFTLRVLLPLSETEMKTY